MTIDLEAFEDALYALVDESPDCDGLEIDVDDDYMIIALRPRDTDSPTVWVDADDTDKIEVTCYPRGLDNPACAYILGAPRGLAREPQDVFAWLMAAQREGAK